MFFLLVAMVCLLTNLGVLIGKDSCLGSCMPIAEFVTCFLQCFYLACSNSIFEQIVLFFIGSIPVYACDMLTTLPSFSTYQASQIARLSDSRDITKIKQAK